MKLWLIMQNVNDGCDTYDSAVVAAPMVEVAQRIHPNGDKNWGARFNEGADCYGTWAQKPEQVTVKYIGEAAEGIAEGVVLASFNAELEGESYELSQKEK
jgi:hypothetical protein